MAYLSTCGVITTTCDRCHTPNLPCAALSIVHIFPDDHTHATETEMCAACWRAWHDEEIELAHLLYDLAAEDFAENAVSLP